MTVVDQAVEQKRHEAREARRGRGRASDEYWCVFDVDQHPNLERAVEKALANGIGVAVSNPASNSGLFSISRITLLTLSGIVPKRFPRDCSSATRFLTIKRFRS